MCGIFGSYSATPLSESDVPVLQGVGVSQLERGTHAFGLAWHCRESSSVRGYKRPGPIDSGVDELVRGVGSHQVIGHTRWATHGDAADNENNHPHAFKYKGAHGLLVHNGIVPRHREIAADLGLHLRSQCDTEIFARHIESGKGTILDRVVAAVAAIDPYAPCCLAVLVNAGLVVARRGNPLWWSDDGNGRCWFASTPRALPGRSWQVPDNTACLIPASQGSPVKQSNLRRHVASSRLWEGSSVFSHGTRPTRLHPARS